MLVHGRIDHIRFDVHIPRDEPEGPPLPWWLDAARMLKPMFLPIDCFTPPDAIERLKRRPVHEANAHLTYVWPGDDGHAEATAVIVRRSCGLLRHLDGGRVGFLLGHGGALADGVLRHGYITEPLRWGRTVVLGGPQDLGPQND
jgi:hypothetical protein